MTFSGLTPAVPATISLNTGTGPAPFFEAGLEQSGGGVALNFELESNFTWQAVASKNNGVTVILDAGGYSAVARPVPEPAVAVLLATGLLALAGLRWLPLVGETFQYSMGSLGIGILEQAFCSNKNLHYLYRGSIMHLVN